MKIQKFFESKIFYFDSVFLNVKNEIKYQYDDLLTY